ncbi:MAG: regulatory protein TetR [Mycobacterium sp.]|jgi:AcrR family transcriptional regulator|nr:regulatory protein TetR [Mycobacterium sp.]MCW2745256.1 regulatory protein TetR [Mycobacterium sp.]
MPDGTADTPEWRASDGRVPGRRGQATRQRLLDTLADLLVERPYRLLTVTDVARAAGTSAATFYQYFPDMESAVLVLARGTVADAAQLRDLIEQGNWQAAEAAETARMLVDAVLAHWGEHAAVLRVVGLLTHDGDGRFAAVRSELLGGLTEALAAAVRRHRTGDRVGDIAGTLAGGLVAMVTEMATEQTRTDDAGAPLTADLSPEELRSNLSRLLVLSVTGRDSAA